MTRRPPPTWLLFTLAAWLTWWCAFKAHVGIESGVTEFLPENVPEVKAWMDGLRRFDGFNAWIVGLEEPESTVSIDGLARVQAVTKKLEDMKEDGVLAVQSVTNVQSLREGEDGAVNSELLVKALPTDAASLDALKQRILGDREVLGALVSRDLHGYAVVIRVDPRKNAPRIARLVQQAVESEAGTLKPHYFGAPFFTAVVAKHLLANVKWLAPVFVLLLLAVFILGAGRVLPVLTVLFSTGLSLLWWLGMLGLFGLSVSISSGNVALAIFTIGGVLFAGLLENPQRGRALLNVLATLFAFAVGCLVMSRQPTAYIASFGASTMVGLLAIAFAAALVIAPQPSAGSWKPVEPKALAVKAMIAVAMVFSCAALLRHTRFLTTPQEMFSAHDEVGETMAFFDNHFGGADFIQVDFKGDLKDPAVAARLLRLTDLLEGTPGLNDVRSVAQILAFLNHGFGDAYRIPTSRDSLANVWFFLEGSGQVRNLVSDKRDEGMIMIRVPSHPTASASDLEKAVAAAINLSTQPDSDVIAARLNLPKERLALVLADAQRAPAEAERVAIDTEVAAQLRKILASPDSPYSPSDEEWKQLESVLMAGPVDLRARLTAAVESMDKLKATGLSDKFVEMMVDRETGLRLNVRGARLAAKLWEGQKNVTDEFKLRATGAVIDLLDPQKEIGKAQITVSGLPVVAKTIEAHLQSALWKAIGFAVLSGLLLLLVRPRFALNGLLAAVTATALSLAACHFAGIDIDSGSATLYLLPAMLAIALSGLGRWPRAFLLAVAAAAVPLLFTGAMPVTRIGAVLSIGLASVLIASWTVGQKADAKA